MRIINLIGVSSYLYTYLKYKSKIGLTVFINGIIFHCNENNKFLLFYDSICCFFFSSYTTYKFKKILPVTLTAYSIFLINNYLYKNQKINRLTSDFIHVFGVQYLGLINLIAYLENKNIEYKKYKK